MNSLLLRATAVTRQLDTAAVWLVPGLARLVFAAVLLVYFLTSSATKIGDGAFGVFFPTSGAFAQIYPRLSEAVGYDPGRIGFLPHVVVIVGTVAETLLPVMIVLGLFTRLAALGMIGFIVMQSLTDILGHGLAGGDIGRWFDAAPDSLILDQRAYWMLGLVTLFLMGGGRFSLDRAIARLVAGMR